MITATRTIVPAELGLPGRAPLFLAGALPPAPRLAVIGSRAARRERIASLGPAVAALAAAGLTLVSGGAIGIDAAAHHAALAAGLPQLAVLPCAADRPYPSQHVPMFQALVRAPESGILFCHPPGAEFSRGMFASRNAVVVGLARALLVVEAAPRSGSHGTGLLALRRRLPVAALLGSPGCDDLVARGARGLPPGAFAPALDAWLAELAGAPPAQVAPWPPELQWLAEALARAGSRGIGLDALEGPPRKFVDLLAAQRLGLVVEAPRGWFRRIS